MSLLEVEVSSESADAGAMPPERNGIPPTREIRHEYTRSLPPLADAGMHTFSDTFKTAGTQFADRHGTGPVHFHLADPDAGERLEKSSHEGEITEDSKRMGDSMLKEQE